MAAVLEVRAVPACGIVQLDTSAARPDEISSVIHLPRGTLLRSGSDKFTTSYDVNVVPVAITVARFQAATDMPAACRPPGGAISDLVITLESIANGTFLGRPPLQKLRICIDGEPGLRAGLLDAIAMRAVRVCIEAHAGWHILAASPFSFVGWQSADSLPEFFHLPQKFEFVDLDLEAIAAHCPPNCKRISMHVLIPGCDPRLGGVGAGNFRLGCTPVANIFRQAAAPIRLDGRSGTYPLLPSQTGCEIYAVESVAVVSRSGDHIVPPFHGTEHGTHGPYWQLDGTFGLRFVDREERPVCLQSGTIAVQLTCTNSGRLQSLARLKTEASTDGFPIRFLVEPTVPRHVVESKPHDEEMTLSALRKLLEHHGCPFTDGLKQLVSKPSTACLGHPMGRVHMRGTEFTILLDEAAMREQSIFSFTELLARIVADSLHENRFAQLKVANQDGQLLHVTSARSGTRPLA